MRTLAQTVNVKSSSTSSNVSELTAQKISNCGNPDKADGGSQDSKKKTSGLQRKLAISAKNDPMEWDADRVKRQSRTDTISGNIYEREADNVALQGLAAPANEHGVRNYVGKMLGVDFSTVRVHREVSAVESQGAHAVAAGKDISFAPGRFRLDLPLGRALFAHELAHTAQQGTVSQHSPMQGKFSEALGQVGGEYSSDKLSAKADTLADQQPRLTQAPLGMQQRCVAGCTRCSEENESSSREGEPSASVTATTTPAPTTTPTPTHAVGPAAATANPKIVRLAWTVDDGPTIHTPGMSSALSPRAATWFVMNNQLGTGATRVSAFTTLVSRQTAGDEIGVHSMHPTVGHSAWFPVQLGLQPSGGYSVPKGYNRTSDAMRDLTSFTGELRTAGLNVHFARMPGGELSEVKKYVVDQGGAAGTSESVAEALISERTPPVAAPASVVTDVALVMSTLRTLNLHLWGGSASGPEVTRTTWEAESSGVPTRTNDIVRRFEGVVNNLATGRRTRPASFVILAHDTTSADVAQAGTNITAMETHATSQGVRVEYYRMADLFQILRGSPP